MNYQDRVKHEQIDLVSKILNLEDFINNSSIFAELDLMEQDRLNNQLGFMSNYNRVLIDRIDNFK